MSGALSLDDIESRIRKEYAAGPYRLGWRFLYCSAATLQSARVALIGLNPGGDKEPVGHGEISCEFGSAYRVERWAGHEPGESPLQRQVLALFEHLGVSPDEVLAGNIVPFRSPSWRELPNRADALRFGQALWREVLANVRPELVVANGKDAFFALRPNGEVKTVGAGWRNQVIRISELDGTSLVGLPHLSRFKIINRAESENGLRAAFGSHWHNP